MSAPQAVDPFDPADLLKRRSRREWRVPIPHSPVRERRNFAEVVHGYSEPQARAEAARCLDCHAYCSLCVGVCPNLALQTFRVRPFSARLPALEFAGGAIRARYSNDADSAADTRFRIEQVFQIALLADLCNECGNCTTFCPTAGEPYRHKPRLYLDRAEFDAQQDNAFMALRPGAPGAGDGWAMDARWAGATHRIELHENGDGQRLDYRGPALRARIDPATFRIERIEADAGAADAESLSLEPCATMCVLLQGLRDSVPHLPIARSPS